VLLGHSPAAGLVFQQPLRARYRRSIDGRREGGHRDEREHVLALQLQVLDLFQQQRAPTSRAIAVSLGEIPPTLVLRLISLMARSRRMVIQYGRVEALADPAHPHAQDGLVAPIAGHQGVHLAGGDAHALHS
jgi:hypothetical protein